MKTGYEIAYLEIMPRFRRAVAQELHNEGMGQVEIARLLNVTQAVISKYINSKDDGKKFDRPTIKAFTEALKRGNQGAANRIRCKLCLDTNKFDCVFVVK